MRLGSIIIASLKKTAIFVSMLLAVPACILVTPPSPAECGDYEIPISELNKVRNKTPVKAKTTGVKRKSKKAAPVPKTASDPYIAAPATAQAPGQPDAPQIHHAPYSYVVTGKQTVIYAVISGTAEIRTVSCVVQGKDDEHLAPVAMALVSGTRFTYTATLPAPSPGSTALRYTIDAEDNSGRKTHSQDFITPVKSSPVVPLWQQEHSKAEKPVEIKSEPVKEPAPLIQKTRQPDNQ